MCKLKTTSFQEKVDRPFSYILYIIIYILYYSILILRIVESTLRFLRGVNWAGMQQFIWNWSWNWNFAGEEHYNRRKYYAPQYLF